MNIKLENSNADGEVEAYQTDLAISPVRYMKGQYDNADGSGKKKPVVDKPPIDKETPSSLPLGILIGMGIYLAFGVAYHYWKNRKK